MKKSKVYIDRRIYVLQAKKHISLPSLPIPPLVKYFEPVCRVMAMEMNASVDDPCMSSIEFLAKTKFACEHDLCAGTTFIMPDGSFFQAFEKKDLLNFERANPDADIKYSPYLDTHFIVYTRDYQLTVDLVLSFYPKNLPE
jgi:hypothetical protein